MQFVPRTFFPTQSRLVAVLIAGSLGLAACSSEDPAADSPFVPPQSDAQAEPEGGLDADSDGAPEASWPDASDAFAPDGADAEVAQVNQGWIGAACASAAECVYDGASCLVDGYPDGMCSMPCDSVCPDPSDADHAGTFCIENQAAPGDGLCVARCEWSWFAQEGCRPGMTCKWRERVGQAWVEQDVCVPDDGSDACMGDEVRQPNLGLVEPPGVGGCPSGMAPVYDAGLCIDRWECHLVELLSGGQQAPWSPYFNPGDRSVKAVSAPGAVPQGYISGDQAAAACAEAGKRLCSRPEWELACMGPEGRTYPYGPVREPGVCNDHRDEHPAIEYFGTSDAWIWSELGHACINQLPSSLDRTGDRTGCTTDGGVFDLMGNLHEWIDDPDGTFKGGFYVDTVLNGEGCLYTTTAHATNHWDYSTGFRCCADW